MNGVRGDPRRAGVIARGPADTGLLTLFPPDPIAREPGMAGMSKRRMLGRRAADVYTGVTVPIIWQRVCYGFAVVSRGNCADIVVRP
jgi:hypothetical protein